MSKSSATRRVPPPTAVTCMMVAAAILTVHLLAQGGIRITRDGTRAVAGDPTSIPLLLVTPRRADEIVTEAYLDQLAKAAALLKTVANAVPVSRQALRVSRHAFRREALGGDAPFYAPRPSAAVARDCEGPAAISEPIVITLAAPHDVRVMAAKFRFNAGGRMVAPLRRWHDAGRWATRIHEALDARTAAVRVRPLGMTRWIDAAGTLRAERAALGESYATPNRL